MSYIIDRRLNSRNKNAVNRQRFMRRYKTHIQKAVQEAIKQRSITDMERGENVSIPASDVDEPTFSHGSGGRRSIVHPGNRNSLPAIGCRARPEAAVAVAAVHPTAAKATTTSFSS